MRIHGIWIGLSCRLVLLNTFVTVAVDANAWSEEPAGVDGTAATEHVKSVLTEFAKEKKKKNIDWSAFRSNIATATATAADWSSKTNLIIEKDSITQHLQQQQQHSTSKKNRDDDQEEEEDNQERRTTTTEFSSFAREDSKSGLKDNSNGPSQRSLQVQPDIGLFDLVARAFIYRLFEAYLNLSRLADPRSPPLSSTRALTCFWPWDDGIPTSMGWPWNGRLKRPGWRSHLVELMRHQCVAEFIAADSLVVGQTYETLIGETVTISSHSNDRVGYGGQLIIGTLETSQGIIHVTSGFVMPSFVDKRLVDIVSTEFTTFSSLMALAGLESTFFQSSLTIFAPSDKAFAKPDGLLDDLQRLDARDRLIETLRYHVVTGDPFSFFVQSLPDAGPPLPRKLTTEQGDSILIQYDADGDEFRVNSATVVRQDRQDMLAVNGVVHEIDEVLIPDLTSLPTASPMVSLSSAPSESLNYFLTAHFFFWDFFDDGCSYQRPAVQLQCGGDFIILLNVIEAQCNAPVDEARTGIITCTGLNEGSLPSVGFGCVAQDEAEIGAAVRIPPASGTCTNEGSVIVVGTLSIFCEDDEGGFFQVPSDGCLSGTVDESDGVVSCLAFDSCPVENACSVTTQEIQIENVMPPDQCFDLV